MSDARGQVMISQQCLYVCHPQLVFDTAAI